MHHPTGSGIWKELLSVEVLNLFHLYQEDNYSLLKMKRLLSQAWNFSFLQLFSTLYSKCETRDRFDLDFLMYLQKFNVEQ